MDQACPSCGNRQIEKGVLSAGFSALQLHKKGQLHSKSSPVGARYCSKCGHILSLYVENPDILGDPKADFPETN